MLKVLNRFKHIKLIKAVFSLLQEFILRSVQVSASVSEVILIQSKKITKMSFITSPIRPHDSCRFSLHWAPVCFQVAV